MKKLRVAVFGGSGYAGGELLRLLHLHPHLDVTVATSEKSAGLPVSSVWPHLTAYSKLVFDPMNAVALAERADLFFLALPHKAAQDTAAELIGLGKRVIDLSADFRLRNPDTYESWYQTPHTKRELLSEAVYGLPERYRSQIKGARLIANPGCYPTSAILGLMPALEAGLVSLPEGIVIDSKSGVSGAGRSLQQGFLFSEVNDGFKAYGLAVHRHTPEIEQELSAIAESEIVVEFAPHLVPMDRGILTTIYAPLAKAVTLEDVHEIYRNRYADEPFMTVLPVGQYPVTKNVRGSNHCHIGLQVNKRTARLIIVSVIDNLVKGAAGQAVHNMNIMMGFDETTAIAGMGVFP